jgi:signal transduction histidine kinase
MRLGDSPISSPTADMVVALSRSVTTARLLSGVVHELNNALLVISGTVELLEERSDLPEPVVRGLERLRRQSSRAAAALAEVLAFTHAPLDDRDDVTLRDVASAAVELRRFAVTRAGLSIQLAPGSEPCMVRGNRGALQQAVLNLIINAEYALVDTHGHITVDAATSGDWAIVRVSDDGPRVPGLGDAMFEPFASMGPPLETAGLGLFAARVIVEAHGGTLVLDEEVAGTSFVIRVPTLTVSAGYAAPSST